MIKRLTLVAALLAWLGGAALAAVTNTPVFVQTPSIGTQNFIQGTDAAGTFKTVYTGGANGSKCTGLMAVTNDGTASHILTVRVVHSATNYPIATMTIPVSVNGNTVYGATLNMMSSANWPGVPTDSDGNPYVYLTNGDTLQVTFATALTSTDQINVVAVCADF